jgi:hypothetical protein
MVVANVADASLKTNIILIQYASSNSPALLASLKSPPKTSTAVRTSSAPTLTTTDSKLFHGCRNLSSNF